MTAPRWTLEEVTYHWADAYLICYTRDRWVALRRDTHQFLTAHSLDELQTAMEADYRNRPVSREFDPLDDADDHIWPGALHDPADDSDQDLDTDTLFIVRGMRRAFPLWAITYSSQLRTWTARTRKTTICEDSAALLCIALALIERKQRQASRGLRWDWSPEEDGNSET